MYEGGFVQGGFVRGGFVHALGLLLHEQGLESLLCLVISGLGDSWTL